MIIFLQKNHQKRGARNGVRTRDLNLGKVALYQLSYSRNCECDTSILFEENKDCQTYFAARRVVFKNYVIVHDLCNSPEITLRIKLDRRPSFI